MKRDAQMGAKANIGVGIVRAFIESCLSYYSRTRLSMNSNGHKSILIVDDEKDVRTLLKRIFETRKPDYKIVTAPDGFIALGRLMQQGFDLVLTDWRMSEMDGLELAEAIQEISPDTRILLMTGSVTSELDGAVKSLGLAGWIEKPFTPTYILNAVKQVMG